MRRRQLVAAQMAMRAPDAIVVPTGPGPDILMMEGDIYSLGADIPKGFCPKCRKQIGRGVAFHTKRCEG